MTNRCSRSRSSKICRFNMAGLNSVVIELEEVEDKDDKHKSEINSRDMEESAALISSNSNEELCPVVSSDALETAISKPGGDAAESHRDSQESTEDSEQNSSTREEKESDSLLLEDNTLSGNEEEGVSCDVKVKKGLQKDGGLEEMRLPWIICEAIWDGDLAKVQRWLNSLPTSRQEQAFQFRLSSKFSGLHTQTAFQHAVYRSENPEIARLFLKTAGEEQLDTKVVRAIKQGNSNVVKSWIKLRMGKCDDYKHWDGGTALHLAAEFNQLDIAKELINDGADPNAKRLCDGATVLHVAYSSKERDSENIVELLLEDENFTIDVTDNKPLHYAVKHGNLSLTQKILQKEPLLVNLQGGDSLTPLHLACEHGCLDVAKVLLAYGADITSKTSDGFTPLHLACKNGQFEIAKLLLDLGADVNAKSRQILTPLHFACKEGHTALVKLLIKCEADVNAYNIECWTPLHNACQEGRFEIAKLLIEHKAVVYTRTYDGMTPLHIACKNDHLDNARLLLNHKADVNARDNKDRSPLDLACTDGHADIARLLLQHRADVTANYTNLTPFYHACQNGHDEVVQLLLENEVEIKPEILRAALEQKYESIVRTIITKAHNWPELMRQTWQNEDEVETTPFREMIRVAPDAAEDVLNMCTVKNPNYTAVAFNYEFVEDFARDSKASTSATDTDGRTKEAKSSRCTYDEVKSYATSNFSTTWGPVRFRKGNHPLAIMVEHERLNLLKHPLISSLLHRKWHKFGQYFYFGNLLAYSVFLIFLTTFALIVPNPRSQMCFNFNSTGNANCGLSSNRQGSIYFTASIVIILALFRLFLEMYQMISQGLRYLLDWVNWMEWFLFVCTVIFVSVFRADCLCVHDWQWQIGIVAVFLGWIELMFFLSKLPLIGIYVVMFLEILKTVLKIIIFSFLLLVAFGLAFYMAFFEPNIMRSPFSNVPRSLLKTMTMSTGELDFDAIFRQNPSGASDGAEEIPFSTVSYILWIVFVILMPVLLTNMLIGLAVGDIGAVQQEAELKKLALQVEQVLTIEELLPKWFRHKLTTGYKEIHPNKKDIGFSELMYFIFCYVCCVCMSRWWYRFQNYQRFDYEKQKKRVSRRAQFIMWGGARYDTHGSIYKIVKPPEDAVSKTDKLLRSVKEMKASNTKEREKTDRLFDRQGKIIGDVEDLKTEKEKIDKLVLDQNKCLEYTSSKTDGILREVEVMKKAAAKERAEFLEVVKEMKDANAKEREALLCEMKELKGATTKERVIILQEMKDSQNKEREVLLQKVEELRASLLEMQSLLAEKQD